MNKKIYAVLVLVLFPMMVFGWYENTHKLISSFACNQSKLNTANMIWKFNLDMGSVHPLNVNGEIKTIAEWIFDGAEKEDATLFRSMQHFHNPLKTFKNSGLIDPVGNDHESQPLWAQDGTLQETHTEGDNSWQRTKYYYFNALIFPDEEMRHAFFGKMFKSLGHQIHLLEDMSNPEHTRNDNHPLVTIEKWAEKHSEDIIRGFCKNSIFPDVDLQTLVFDQSTEKNLIPISRLSDADVYELSNPIPSNARQQGLAEYSNANFVSDDTKFSSDFPHPSFSNVDISKIFVKINPNYKPDEKGAYLPKINDGDPITHFLRVPYLKKYLDQTLFDFSYLDEMCYKDYASMLIPRAVGYSAALLDYFFRGEIEITIPENDGIYALCVDSNIGFEKISLMVKNITPNNEEMKNGQISLIISYRTGSGSPFIPNPPMPQQERHFIKADYYSPNPITIPRDSPIKLDFDLTMTGVPLPVTAVDVTLAIVFKGDLGAEQGDAVAIGFKDISEPSPVDLFNNTDLVCFNSLYTNYDDPNLLNQVDSNHNGRIDCDQNEINIIPLNITPLYLSFNNVVADANNYYYKFPELNPIIVVPGQSFRFYFLANDDPAMARLSVKVKADNILNSPIPTVGLCYTQYNNTCGDLYHYFNKLLWKPDLNLYSHSYAGVGYFRGINYYNFLYYENVSIPEEPGCSPQQVVSSQTNVGTESSAITTLINIPKTFPKRKVKSMN